VSEKSQRAAIARHLRAGKSLTALDALERFSTLRLSGRIFELRQQGMKILSYPLKVGRGEKAKRVSCYYALRGRAA